MTCNSSVLGLLAGVTRDLLLHHLCVRTVRKLVFLIGLLFESGFGMCLELLAVWLSLFYPSAMHKIMGSLPVLPTNLHGEYVASVLEIIFEPAGRRICIRARCCLNLGVPRAFIAVVLVPLPLAPFPHDMSRR